MLIKLFFTSKRKLKAQIAQLEYELNRTKNIKEGLLKYNNDLADYEEQMSKQFPFLLGQTVYDVQLRSSRGKHTKNKASRKHSLIKEVIVTRDNYFELVDRYESQNVYLVREHAEQYIDSVSVD